MSKYSANHVAQRHIINFRVIAYYDEISRFNIIHNYNMKKVMGLLQWQTRAAND